MAKGPDILDLDKIVGDKRIVRLEGKEIDVSKIPSIVVLRGAKIYESIDENDPEAMDKIVDIMMDIIKPQNEGVTREWLLNNTSFTQLYTMLEFVLEPLNEMVATDSGNAVKPQGN